MQRYSSAQTKQRKLNPFPRALFPQGQQAKQKKQPPPQVIETALPTTKSHSQLPSLGAKERPLARDFIHNSLYHHEYGYFSKRAIIFSQPDPVDFNALSTMEDFEREVNALYTEYDDYQSDEALQVWHTPTELFKPWYGYAIANYILQEYRSHPKFRNRPLIIYEMGAGNGTMMCNILDYLKDNAPDVYASAQYNIIEISSQLSDRQEWNNMSRLKQQVSNYNHVSIINKSIFEWDRPVDDACFFIALEVIDNFAHDIVRYDLSKSQHPPQQCRIVTQPDGRLEEQFEPLQDELIQRYLNFRELSGRQSPALESINPLWQKIRSVFPQGQDLSEREFLPTMQMRFMEVLRSQFPNHSLILSDFDKLPTDVEGVCAPVVQTRQRGRMVPCSTYLVTPGWFDIFFPTDFQEMADIYGLLMMIQTSAVEGQERSVAPLIAVKSHRDFLMEYGDLDKSRTRSGDVPLIDYYRNVAFLLTHA